MSQKIRKNKYLLALLLFLCLLAIGLAGCSSTQASGGDATQVQGEIQEEAALPVTVTTAVRRDISKTLALGGLLRPQEEVTLMGGGAGSRVLQVAVAVGDQVSRGQVILTQDMRDLDIQEQNLLLNRQQLQENYDKNKALFEAGAMAESQLTALENQMKLLDLQLEALRLNREKMAVTSTIDGIVSALPVVVGQMAAAATPVARVVNIDKLLLEVQVGESYIMGVKAGDELEIMIPAFRATPVPGRVKTIPPDINAQTRAYTVTVEVDNQDLAIKGGMYGELQLVVEKVENALVIPQYAILKLEEGTAVFIEENGVARRKLVTVGMTLGDEAEILSGLAAGDKVIVEGQYTATEGRKLNTLSRGEGQ
jgi:RND family efflux transporter MFP subunit